MQKKNLLEEAREAAQQEYNMEPTARGKLQPIIALLLIELIEILKKRGK